MLTGKLYLIAHNENFLVTNPLQQRWDVLNSVLFIKHFNSLFHTRDVSREICTITDTRHSTTLKVQTKYSMQEIGFKSRKRNPAHFVHSLLPRETTNRLL